jgi:hypothetical protein
MHNRANTNTDKAAAARFQRKLVRGRSRRRVAFSTIALFALVFALLSFRLTAGLDPSSSGNTVATTTSTQSATDDNSNSGSSSNSSGPGSGDDDDDDDYEYDDSEDSSESADDDSTYSDESLSADSTTSSPAPTTRAS